ncbi:uncharacterized protein V6R79_025834 [Siganus canaliculatus]
MKPSPKTPAGFKWKLRQLFLLLPPPSSLLFIAARLRFQTSFRKQQQQRLVQFIPAPLRFPPSSTVMDEELHVITSADEVSVCELMDDISSNRPGSFRAVNIVRLGVFMPQHDENMRAAAEPSRAELS